MSTDQTSISPSTFTAAGESVASALERAAIPGRPPLPTPGMSPADTAASGLATAMATRISAATTEMAPRGPAMRTAAQSAAAGIQAQDLANSQKIAGVATSQSAIDQLMRGLSEGGAGSPKPPADSLLAALSARGSITDSAVDDATKGIKSFSDLRWKDAAPSVEDWAWNGVGAAVSSKTDVPGYFVAKATENLAKGDPGHWAKSWFSETGWKSLKMRPATGVLAAPLLLWNIHHDMETPAMSARQAIAKEGGGFLASAAAGAGIGTLIGGPFGTVAGLVVGAAVGAVTSNAIDKLWEPSANAIGHLLHGG